jgi:hypothetical protein
VPTTRNTIDIASLIIPACLASYISFVLVAAAEEVLGRLVESMVLSLVRPTIAIAIATLVVVAKVGIVLTVIVAVV